MDENTSTTPVQCADKIVDNVRLVKTIGARTKQALRVQTRSKTKKVTFQQPVDQNDSEEEIDEEVQFEDIETDPLLDLHRIFPDDQNEIDNDTDESLNEYSKFLQYQPIQMKPIIENPSRIVNLSKKDLSVIILSEIDQMCSDLIKKNDLKLSDLSDVQYGELKLLSENLAVLLIDLDVFTEEKKTAMFNLLSIVYTLFVRENNYEKLHCDFQFRCPNCLVFIARWETFFVFLFHTALSLWVRRTGVSTLGSFFSSSSFFGNRLP